MLLVAVSWAGGWGGGAVSLMMGGGFGGCTINLVKDDIYDKFVEDITAKFTAKYGHAPEIYPVIISEGSHKVC